jgi:amino acid adenylation domain-containing protein
VNLLPIRTYLRSEASFQDNLAAVKKSVLDAYDHHQCTIGTILQHVSVPRSAGRQPLVEVIFNVDRDPSASEFLGLNFVCHRNPKRALHYDLFFNFVEGPCGLYVECDYNTDLFDAATMERWIGHYRTLLGSITAMPAESIGTLSLLTEGEREKLVTGLNDRAVELPKNLLIHNLFERQAEQTPDARAVTFEGRHLTYGELNRRANQVSHCLKALGAGPDVPIGLFLERSPEMLVGILGILKTGAAYVPMDPEYPKERLGYILQDSQAPIVVTQKSLVGNLPDFVGRSICLDTDWADIAREREENPLSHAAPKNLAYVLFTSGSTGRPKGVALEHHSAVTFVQWASRVFTPQELSGVLFSTSVCFDLSIFEMFVTLNAGGTIIIAPNALHLPSLSAKNAVTLINTVPSAMTELLHMGAVPSSLKVVNLAGEALSDALVEQIYAQTKVEKVYNLYGPTEATTYSTYTLVPRGYPVTIGRPIANTQVYILDTHRNLVPRGVLGELYLAGEGLARGYYGRPDLTNERFVPNPFDAQPGARMYRTGDLCRWLPDKSIQYLGRLDHQIKLRGFRIELGEVEATLDRYPGIRQSLVMAREDQPGHQRLVAYVVPEAGTTLQMEELRLHIKKSLPEFMLPSSIVVLEAFPLSPNGKIDRKSLPSPDEQSLEPARDYMAPQDPLEQVLTHLWAKVLRVGRVGLHDNFFDLGGHSLLAVRIIVEIEKLYKKRLPLATLLQMPTVGDLASVLRKEQWVPSWSSLVPIRPGGSRPPLFLFHSHGGNVLEYYPLVDLLDSDQPVYALQAKGLDGSILKNRSLEEMVTGYLEEIRTLQPQGPYYIGGFCFGGLSALEAANQLSTCGEEVALVAMIQTVHPGLTTSLSNISGFPAWWDRVKKRWDLERENVANRGFSHIQDRMRRSFDTLTARSAIASDNLIGNNRQSHSSRSMAYILEMLSIEHDKAYDRYQPKAYQGNAVLFRTEKQLSGLTAHRSLGWEELLGGKLEICNVPGHQQNVLADPNVSRLAEELMARLNSAQERWAEKKSTRLAS